MVDKAVEHGGKAPAGESSPRANGDDPAMNGSQAYDGNSVGGLGITPPMPTGLPPPAVPAILAGFPVGVGPGPGPLPPIPSGLPPPAVAAGSPVGAGSPGDM
jgi:hypothetical protein